MNSDNIVARLDATFENTLRFDAELQAVYVVEKSNILYNTTAGWNSQAELVAKAGYLYVYIDYKQTEDNQNIAGFKVGDNTSLLIDLPFTDSIIYTSIEDIENGLNEIGYAIESLNTNKVNNVNPSTSGALSHTGNAIVTGTMTAQEGFIGNLDGKATSAENADTVNNLSVLTAVPENAKFTDTDKLANLKDVSFTNPTEGQIPKYNAEAEKWENVDDNKLDKNNPTGTGAFSLNRKAETTIGSNSFVEGYDNTASGSCAHAEGQGTTASGNNGSHAEGRQTTASGLQSHAEGYATTAAGAYSHAEGSATHTGLTALASHAEGSSTTASGANSHAEGEGTTASGKDSHAGGHGTIAKNLSQHVFGEFNIQDPANKSSTVRGTYVEIVGNGTNTNTRSNARTLDWSGNETLAGGLTASGNIDVKDSEGNTKISLNGSTGDISCTSINGVAPTEVVANPSDEGSADLTKIKIGNSIYDIPQGGSGSGGHTIVDNEGVGLEQRTKLQFKGAYSEDNSTDDTTEVNVVREMTKAEFDLLSADEKTGFINITDESLNATEIPITDGSQTNTKSYIDSGLSGKVDKTDFDATNLPIQSGSATNTKDYIDTGLSGKQNRTWTLLGTLTGTQTLTLPNGWNEAFVVGRFGGNAQYGFTSYIISTHTGNPYRFINGCGQSTDNHQIIWKIVGGDTISFDTWKYNGTNYTTTSSLIVYYR